MSIVGSAPEGDAHKRAKGRYARAVTDTRTQKQELEAPTIEVECIADHSPPSMPGAWLRHRRPELRMRTEEGGWSDSFIYEHVERRAMDAVVVALHDGERVLLRTALRPPLLFRSEMNVPLDEEDVGASIWELPAGLIEPDERGDEGVRRCAIRETEEETGYQLKDDQLEVLGARRYLSPGVIAEELHFFAADIRGVPRGEIIGDGSPVEEGATMRMVPFALACEMVKDVKSEMAIRRLMAKLEVRS